MTEEKKEKPKLTEAEIQELAEMDYAQKMRWYADRQTLEKLKNTVDALEADLESTKGLKRFISPGVLVNDQLVLYSKAEEFRTVIGLRAFGNEVNVNVELTIEEANRLRRLLPEVVQCTKKKRNLIKLKELLKEKTSRRY
jgi:hypothetical protein